MGYNNLRECELAYSRDELKDYLEGIGKYQEPPDRYSNNPPVDIFTRNNCINSLYDRDKDMKYIEKYMSSLIELSKGRIDQLEIAMRYIMAQLQLEQDNSASFNLNSKDFYEEIKNTIQSKEHEIKSSRELAGMWEILDLQDQYISSKTGYNIK